MDFWLKVRVWSKVGLFAIVALFTLVFIYNNDLPVTFWFIHSYQTNLLWLLLFTFLFGIAVALLSRTVSRTFKQLTDLRDRERVQKLSDQLDADAQRRKEEEPKTKPAP